ncbi:hypothetical protein HYPSUDRAFT_215550 [Hypholoma sublateritium FD-334 SS-4]|uniref:Uncharacterized protein n=1 Tax=Hypholoma sublateritium (strain FD-334 SS-4) TaxID=945553 RepID=A0A0D2MGP3_HYPSF|nr:hypothetical protein HYPSUDRAFT_215550 [Hypholoma sublateritium FD-334 SS-4]
MPHALLTPRELPPPNDALQAVEALVTPAYTSAGSGGSGLFRCVQCAGYAVTAMEGPMKSTAIYHAVAIITRCPPDTLSRVDAPTLPAMGPAALDIYDLHFKVRVLLVRFAVTKTCTMRYPAYAARRTECTAGCALRRHCGTFVRVPQFSVDTVVDRLCDAVEQKTTRSNTDLIEYQRSLRRDEGHHRVPTGGGRAVRSGAPVESAEGFSAVVVPRGIM